MAEKKNMDGSDSEEQRTPDSTRPRKSNSSEKESPSRKRKPNQEKQETRITTRKPRILRLFGVDIPIPEADEGTETTLGNPTRNPNSDQQEAQIEAKEPRILTLFGFNIPVLVEADQGTITIHESPPRNPNPDQGTITIHENPPRNPNSHDQEEEVHALIPQQPEEVEVEQHLHPPVLLFEKELESTDVMFNHNRLLITGSYELMKALTQEERQKVEINKKDYLRVMTTDAQGDVYKLHLTKWITSGAIVLIHEWRKFVSANKLQKGDTVQGWGYRVGAEFRLAISVVRKSS